MKTLRSLRRLALCALLALPRQHAACQDAVNPAKAQRLAFYRDKVLAQDYDYLVGTYQKQNEPQVRALLNSLGLQYHLLNREERRKIGPQFSSINEDGAEPLKLSAQQGAFGLPRPVINPNGPSPAYSPRDDFETLNPFQVQGAILQVARSPWVDDFVLANDQAGAPINSVAYNFDRRVFFDDPDKPDLQQALARLTAMLKGFFGRFQGASLSLSAADSAYFWFTLKVNDMHNAVISDLKDAERLEGEVTLAPRFGTNNLFLLVSFNGSYAPMPNDRPPAEGRYVDFQPEYGEALDRFGQKLTSFLQSQYHATLRP